jgi:putative protease
LRSSGLSKFRVELLDEDEAAATKTIRAYQDLLAGRAGAIDLLEQVEAIEKLGVTEGTLKM